MKTPLVTVFATAAGLTLAGAASAASGTISGAGADFIVDSGSMPGLFAGVTTHEFVDIQMDMLHNAIHADGVSTDSLVTFALVESADGVAFVSLVDDNTRPLHQNMSWMNFTSNATGNVNYWVNDLGYDVLDITQNGGITTANGQFEWNDGAGDAFAWSSIGQGTQIDFTFNQGGGNALFQSAPFQFLTNVDGIWTSLKRGDFNEGGFNFEFAMPAPGALALIGLAGLAGSRRRRG